jgi:hypothetical protein
MNIMIENLLTIAVAALLVWKVLLLIPMVPGKLIDTRDFSSLPRWQYNWFNVFLTSLGISSLIIAGFAVTGNTWVFLPALIIALLYIIACLLDLFEIFPVVKDKLPIQLLILEAIVLGSAGVLLVVSIAGLRI